jgi:hypothetical protein
LGIDHVLDERDDWLMRALPRGPGAATHLLVIVSEDSEASWWLPFQIDRAHESGLGILLFLERPRRPPPAFLHGPARVEHLDALRAELEPLALRAARHD